MKGNHLSKLKGFSFPEAPHPLLSQHKPSASPAPCGKELPKQSPVPPKPAFYRLHVTPQLLYLKRVKSLCMSPVVLSLPCPLSGTSFPDRGIQLGWKVVQTSSAAGILQTLFQLYCTLLGMKGPVFGCWCTSDFTGAKCSSFSNVSSFLMSHLIF